MKHDINGRAFRLDQVELRKHDARMDAGCLVCRSAVPGRVCPDCYTCIACQPGCDECAEARGLSAHPRIPRLSPRKPPGGDK